MAKKVAEEKVCNMGCKCCGWIWLIVGVLFLLKDFRIWNFFNINPLTAIIVLIGCHMLCKAKGYCK